MKGSTKSSEGSLNHCRPVRRCPAFVPRLEHRLSQPVGTHGTAGSTPARPCAPGICGKWVCVKSLKSKVHNAVSPNLACIPCIQRYHVSRGGGVPRNVDPPLASGCGLREDTCSEKTSFRHRGRILPQPLGQSSVVAKQPEAAFRISNMRRCVSEAYNSLYRNMRNVTSWQQAT